MEFGFRDCTLNDLEFVLHLKDLGLRWYIEILYGWDEDVQRRLTKNEIEKFSGDMRIITCQGQDIGVTTFTEYEDCFEVGLFVIHPSFQNKGIASKILKDYIAIACQNKKRIKLKVYKENSALKLYERVGFNEYKRDDTHVYLDINFD